MPHIRALFPENPEIRKFLKTNKVCIRANVAEVLGYPPGEVALYPDPISREDIELADNLLPLEFVVDSGTRASGKEHECAEKICQRILEECSGAEAISFGVWIVSHGQNGFVGHMPQEAKSPA